MKHLLISLLLLGGGSFLAAAADTPVAKTESTAWTFKPDPSLPNVLILGDSISIGYTLQVRRLLKGKANVFRPTSADGTKPVNCEGTTAGVGMIDQWLAGRNWSVIHFNWGLHDFKHVVEPGTSRNSSNPGDPVQATVEEYSRNLEVIVGRLQDTKARLIFATTTPVAVGTTNPLREVEAPVRYNAAALKIMQAHGIAVNDLFAFCAPRLNEFQRPRNVHFTAAGSNALAQQVASVIEAALIAPTSEAGSP